MNGTLCACGTFHSAKGTSSSAYHFPGCCILWAATIMTTGTHEQTLNIALGEVLGRLRQSWATRTERTGNVLVEGGRPDILIEEASGWPVVIEAERSSHAAAETDSKNRLGKTVASTGRQIETAIALVYPPAIHSLDGPELRAAIDSTLDLEYALYTHRIDKPPDRLPDRGWIQGNVRDLAMLVHRAAVPPPRIEALATELENGVRVAAEHFTRRHGLGSEFGEHVAGVLGQSDDKDEQTRRMAMTVIAMRWSSTSRWQKPNFRCQRPKGARLVECVALNHSVPRAYFCPQTSATNGNAFCP